MRQSKHLICFFSALLLASSCVAQTNPLGSVELKTLRGKTVSFSSITQTDSLVLVCFWSTSSQESISELTALNSSFENWKMRVKFHLIAVATDVGVEAGKIHPMINANEWKFDVYLDQDGALQGALNATQLPESIIIKGGKALYQQSGYVPGSEKYLFQKLAAIGAGRG